MKGTGTGRLGTLDSMTCPPKGGLYEKQQGILQHPNPNVSPGASRLLIVGCGNPAAGDDSAGIEIVRRLSELGGCGCELRAEPLQELSCWRSFP